MRENVSIASREKRDNKPFIFDGQSIGIFLQGISDLQKLCVNKTIQIEYIGKSFFVAGTAELILSKPGIFFRQS